jgi:hypothetical protein
MLAGIAGKMTGIEYQQPFFRCEGDHIHEGAPQDERAWLG